MTADFNRVRLGPIDAHIGKNGITPGMIDHLIQLIKQKKIIKVKVMRETAHELGIDTIIEQLLAQLKVFILDVRGYTLILSKKKIPGMVLPKRYAKFVPTLPAEEESEPIDETTPEAKGQESDQHSLPFTDSETDEIDFEKIKEEPAFQEYVEKEKGKTIKPLDYEDEDAIDELDSATDTPEEKIARQRLQKQKKVEAQERESSKNTPRRQPIIIEDKTSIRTNRHPGRTGLARSKSNFAKGRFHQGTRRTNDLKRSTKSRTFSRSTPSPRDTRPTSRMSEQESTAPRGRRPASRMPEPTTPITRGKRPSPRTPEPATPVSRGKRPAPRTSEKKTPTRRGKRTETE